MSYDFIAKRKVDIVRKILIRFDDICPTMDFTQFYKAIDILERYKIKPLLGVIPDCQDGDLDIEPYHEEFWELIRDLQKKGYTLAMHGYQHKFDSNIRGKVNLGYNSEFAGHSYEVQLKKIALGRQILSQHGIETDIFFAPAHSYDDNTLKALSDNGFKYISDGRSNKPFLIHNIISVPCRSGGVPKIKSDGYYTCVFHAHEWVRTDKSYCFEEFIFVCENYHNDIVGFSEYMRQDLGNSKLEEKVEYWDTKINRGRYFVLKWSNYLRDYLNKTCR